MDTIITNIQKSMHQIMMRILINHKIKRKMNQHSTFCSFATNQIVNKNNSSKDYHNHTTPTTTSRLLICNRIRNRYNNNLIVSRLQIFCYFVVTVLTFFSMSNSIKFIWWPHHHHHHYHPFFVIATNATSTITTAATSGTNLITKRNTNNNHNNLKQQRMRLTSNLGQKSATTSQKQQQQHDDQNHQNHDRNFVDNDNNNHKQQNRRRLISNLLGGQKTTTTTSYHRQHEQQQQQRQQLHQRFIDIETLVTNSSSGSSTSDITSTTYSHSNNNNSNRTQSSLVAINRSDDTSYGNDHDQQINMNRKRQLTEVVTARTVLAIRIQTVDLSPTVSSTEISNAVFGYEVGSLTIQMKQCSRGTIVLEPYTNTINGITYDSAGIITISIDNTIDVSLSTQTDLVDATISSIYELTGIVDIRTVANHVMFIIPNGIINSNTFLASAEIDGSQSIFLDTWSLSLSGLMHEFGHNLNLYHSASWDDIYGDITGYMGRSMAYEYTTSSTDLQQQQPLQCYNAQNHWNLNWYVTNDSGFNLRTEINVDDNSSSTAVLIQITAFVDANLIQGSRNDLYEEVVLVKVNHNIYIQYNRAKSYNIGTRLLPDQLVIVYDDLLGSEKLIINDINNVERSNAIIDEEGNEDNSIQQPITILLAGLDKNEYDIYNDYNVTIQVCDVITDTITNKDSMIVSIGHILQSSACDIYYTNKDEQDQEQEQTSLPQQIVDSDASSNPTTSKPSSPPIATVATPTTSTPTTITPTTFKPSVVPTTIMPIVATTTISNQPTFNPPTTLRPAAATNPSNKPRKITDTPTFSIAHTDKPSTKAQQQSNDENDEDSAPMDDEFIQQSKPSSVPSNFINNTDTGTSSSTSTSRRSSVYSGDISTGGIIGIICAGTFLVLFSMFLLKSRRRYKKSHLCDYTSSVLYADLNHTDNNIISHHEGSDQFMMNHSDNSNSTIGRFRLPELSNRSVNENNKRRARRSKRNNSQRRSGIPIISRNNSNDSSNDHECSTNENTPIIDNTALREKNSHLYNNNNHLPTTKSIIQVLDEVNKVTNNPEDHDPVKEIVKKEKRSNDVIQKSSSSSPIQKLTNIFVRKHSTRSASSSSAALTSLARVSSTSSEPNQIDFTTSRSSASGVSGVSSNNVDNNSGDNKNSLTSSTIAFPPKKPSLGVITKNLSSQSSVLTKTNADNVTKTGRTSSNRQLLPKGSNNVNPVSPSRPSRASFSGPLDDKEVESTSFESVLNPKRLMLPNNNSIKNQKPVVAAPSVPSKKTHVRNNSVGSDKNSSSNNGNSNESSDIPAAAMLQMNQNIQPYFQSRHQRLGGATPPGTTIAAPHIIRPLSGSQSVGTVSIGHVSGVSENDSHSHLIGVAYVDEDGNNTAEGGNSLSNSQGTTSMARYYEYLLKQQQMKPLAGSHSNNKDTRSPSNSAVSQKSKAAKVQQKLILPNSKDDQEEYSSDTKSPVEQLRKVSPDHHNNYSRKHKNGTDTKITSDDEDVGTFQPSFHGWSLWNTSPFSLTPTTSPTETTNSTLKGNAKQNQHANALSPGSQKPVPLKKKQQQKIHSSYNNNNQSSRHDDSLQTSVKASNIRQANKEDNIFVDKQKNNVTKQTQDNHPAVIRSYDLTTAHTTSKGDSPIQHRHDKHNVRKSPTTSIVRNSGRYTLQKNNSSTHGSEGSFQVVPHLVDGNIELFAGEWDEI